MDKTKQPVAKGHKWLGWTQPARSTGVRFSGVRYPQGKDVLQTPLPVVVKVHEDGNSHCELDEFFLNLLPQTLIFLFFFG